MQECFALQVDLAQAIDFGLKTLITTTTTTIGRGDNIKKLDFSHAHLHGGSKDIYEQHLFYWYLTFFSKITTPRTKYLFFRAQKPKGGPWGENLFSSKIVSNVDKNGVKSSEMLC